MIYKWWINDERPGPSQVTCYDMKTEKFVKITVIENEIEAQLVRSVLSERGLPYRIRSFHDTAYDGLYQFQMGWGELHAPQNSKQEIMHLLDSIRNSDQSA